MQSYFRTVFHPLTLSVISLSVVPTVALAFPNMIKRHSADLKYALHPLACQFFYQIDLRHHVDTQSGARKSQMCDNDSRMGSGAWTFTRYWPVPLYDADLDHSKENRDREMDYCWKTVGINEGLEVRHARGELGRNCVTSEDHFWSAVIF